MAQESGDASETPLDHEEVLELVRRIQETRDPEAFKLLYKRYHPEMVTFLCNRGIPSEEAEELAQDALMRVWEKISLFRAQPGTTFDAWVQTLLGNVWRNHLRTLQTQGRTADRKSLESMTETGSMPETTELPGSHAFPRPPPSPESEVMQNERYQQVRTAVASLPPGMRRVLGYRLDQGMKYAEIAATEGVSLGTVRSQISTAYGKLRDLLGPPFDKLDGGDG